MTLVLAPVASTAIGGSRKSELCHPAPFAAFTGGDASHHIVHRQPSDWYEKGLITGDALHQQTSLFIDRMLIGSRFPSQFNGFLSASARVTA
jgi:hypothetical protein